MSSLFDLYQPVNNDDSIVKIESRTYLPFVKSFANNDVIEININRPDVWLQMSEAALIVKGKVTKTNGTGEVTLVNNAGAHLFESITFELCGTEIETVRDPGIVSTIRGFLCYKKNHNTVLSIAGWNYPNGTTLNDNGKFNLRMPLKHFFNFFNDYPMAIMGKQNLRIVRARNDFNALLIQPGDNEAAAPTTAEISIESIELRVNHITPNDILKLELLQAIKIDKPVLMPFRRWELHELPALTANAQKQIWNVKTSSAVDCPRFVICCFHVNRKNSVSQDPNYFDNINITNIRLLLNGEYYPQEQWHLNFASNDFSEAYYNYAEFSSNYENRKKSPVLTYDEYKNKALFVIDCSRRDETFKSSTVDVKLEIESLNGFPAGTRAYCIIVHDTVLEYRALSENVRKIM